MNTFFVSHFWTFFERFSQKKKKSLNRRIVWTCSWFNNNGKNISTNPKGTMSRRSIIHTIWWATSTPSLLLWKCIHAAFAHNNAQGAAGGIPAPQRQWRWRLQHMTESQGALVTFLKTGKHGHVFVGRPRAEPLLTYTCGVSGPLPADWSTSWRTEAKTSASHETLLLWFLCVEAQKIFTGIVLNMQELVEGVGWHL